MLFVGNESDAGLTARKAASLIRGVSPAEVEQLVAELNQEYAADRAAYRIIQNDDTFRLQLCDDLNEIRARLHGRIRKAHLSHAAIEVLAVVAYHQPATTEEVDRLRNHKSGPILNQLVRRELLSVVREDTDRHIRRYVTTERFLGLFGLESIDDLPQAHIDNELEFLDQ